MHPAAFLAGSIVLCAAWLWLRPVPVGEITFDADEPAKGFVAELLDGRHRARRVD